MCCGPQLKLMVEIELSYMNTNHPDFIGFDRASKTKQGGTRTASHQLIRKGWLSIPVSLIKGSTREYWFVLSSDSLTWYKDNEVGLIPMCPCPLLHTPVFHSPYSILFPNTSFSTIRQYLTFPFPFPRVCIPPFLMCPYLNPQEKEQKYSLRLEDMRVRDIEAGRFSIGKKHVFALFYTTGK